MPKGELWLASLSFNKIGPVCCHTYRLVPHVHLHTMQMMPAMCQAATIASCYYAGERRHWPTLQPMDQVYSQVQWWLHAYGWETWWSGWLTREIITSKTSMKDSCETRQKGCCYGKGEVQVWNLTWRLFTLRQPVSTGYLSCRLFTPIVIKKVWHDTCGISIFIWTHDIVNVAWNTGFLIFCLNFWISLTYTVVKS